jgi:hypothetical protein
VFQRSILILKGEEGRFVHRAPLVCCSCALVLNRPFSAFGGAQSAHDGQDSGAPRPITSWRIGVCNNYSSNTVLSGDGPKRNAVWCGQELDCAVCCDGGTAGLLSQDRRDVLHVHPISSSSKGPMFLVDINKSRSIYKTGPAPYSVKGYERGLKGATDEQSLKR